MQTLSGRPVAGLVNEQGFQHLKGNSGLVPDQYKSGISRKSIEDQQLKTELVAVEPNLAVSIQHITKYRGNQTNQRYQLVFYLGF